MHPTLLMFLLIGVLQGSFCDVGTKSIAKRHTQPDWLTTPEAIGTFIYEAVNAVSPKAAELLKTTYQEKPVLEARRFVISTFQTAADLIYQTYKKMRSFWEPEDTTQH